VLAKSGQDISRPFSVQTHVHETLYPKLHCMISTTHHLYCDELLLIMQQL